MESDSFPPMGGIQQGSAAVFPPDWERKSVTPAAPEAGITGKKRMKGKYSPFVRVGITR